MQRYRCEHRAPYEGAEVCGLETECAVRPDYRCDGGHDPTWWTCGLETLQQRDECASTTRHGVEPSDVAEFPAATDVAVSSAMSPLILTPPATRQRLPVERQSVTRLFRLRYKHKDGSDDVMHLYFIAGCYKDGRIGEIFVTVDRMGSFARGALDATAMMASMLLQHGVPLATVTAKLRHTRYEPSGWTGDKEFPSCTSPLDLLAQWLDRRFGAVES